MNIGYDLNNDPENEEIDDQLLEDPQLRKEIQHLIDSILSNGFLDIPESSISPAAKPFVTPIKYIFSGELSKFVDINKAAIKLINASEYADSFTVPMIKNITALISNVLPNQFKTEIDIQSMLDQVNSNSKHKNKMMLQILNQVQISTLLLELWVQQLQSPSNSNY